jgi:hypothetical protein
MYMPSGEDTARATNVRSLSVDAIFQICWVGLPFLGNLVSTSLPNLACLGWRFDIMDETVQDYNQNASFLAQIHSKYDTQVELNVHWCS